MTTAPELRGPRVLLSPVAPDHHARLRQFTCTRTSCSGGKSRRRLACGARSRHTHYSIFHGDQLIGFIQWYEAEDNPDFRHAGLDLFLDPDFHGRGSVANRYGCCVPT